MSYEFVRSTEYWDASKLKTALSDAGDEISRLMLISAAQSKHLAQALKEKNDLQHLIDGQLASNVKDANERTSWLEDRLKVAQLDLSAVQQRHREMTKHARALLEGLGVL
jgi:hypothetical protein